MRANAIAVSIAYALRHTAPWQRPICGRIAAVYESSTGYEWWSGKLAPALMQASFANRMLAVQQMIFDGTLNRDGTPKEQTT